MGRGTRDENTSPDSRHHQLEYTCARKSSYNGRNRCQMLQDDMQHKIRSGWGGLAYLSAVPTTEQWEAAKASLIAKGLLNKAGAVTVAGRNART